MIQQNAYADISNNLPVDASTAGIVVIKKDNYVLKIFQDGTFELYNGRENLQFIKNHGIPFLPLTNRAVIWDKPHIKYNPKESIITYEIPSNVLYCNPEVKLICKDDHIEFYFRAKAKKRMSLERWYLFGAGTAINAIECLNFRSHINSAAAYETNQTILARRRLGSHGLDVSTEDSDLMFAPHPMMFLFNHLSESIVIAPMELIQAESLHLKMNKGSTVIDKFYIRIGENIFWLEEGEEFESPHFLITLTHHKDVYESIANYTNILVQEKKVKPKKEDDVCDWWLSPMWCSWGDQHTILDSEEVISAAYTQEERAKAADRINQSLLENVTGIIDKHQLPVKTLIIDDRWYTKKGDMKVDTQKFPNIRKTVDQLHKKGFKVLAWASFYKFEHDSEAFMKHPEWFISYHYERDHHNPGKDLIFFDYTNTEIAKMYLNEIMGRLLSDAPGCYNFDGIKFDWPYLVPQDYVFENREWVGKEFTIYKTQKLIYNIAKSKKRDALIIGVSPHPFFNDTQDIIRTYDISTYDIRIHLERAKYIQSIAPGMKSAIDEHVFHQNFFEFIEEGSKVGIPMIYNLIKFNGDGHIYTESDYAKLKSLLDKYVNNVPKLKKYFHSLGL